MKFKEIYNQSIKFWPQRVDISDGKIQKNGGVYFENLSRIYEEIEDKIDHRDAWLELMTWCVFKYLHRSAKKLLNTNHKELELSSLNLKELENIFYSAMCESTTGFQELKDHYVNDL